VLLSWDIHTTEIFAEGFRDKIFDTEIVAALVRALGDTFYGVSTGRINFFTVAMAQGALHCFDGRFILKYAEGFRDKIFDTEIVAALGRALGDKESNVRRSAVEIFTYAVAQGALSYFYRIFILKYLQRGFETRCLILRLSPHLYMH